MDGISSYLNRFRKLIGDKKEEKEVVRDVIRAHTKLDIPSEQISFREGALIFQISPLYRSEILIQKKAILAELKERGFFIRDLR